MMNPRSYPQMNVSHLKRRESIQMKKGEVTCATFLARLLTFFVMARDIALKKRIKKIPIITIKMSLG